MAQGVGHFLQGVQMASSDSEIEPFFSESLSECSPDPTRCSRH
jgi:hypothetical protein